VIGTQRFTGTEEDVPLADLVAMEGKRAQREVYCRVPPNWQLDYYREALVPLFNKYRTATAVSGPTPLKDFGRWRTERYRDYLVRPSKTSHH
jgi:hypothetical protein